MKEYLSRSVEETREYARQFAAGLQAGDVVCLSGNLGAGKTEFMRGIAQVFNCDDQLTSPSFSIFNIYQGRLNGEPVKLQHFDLYRIETSLELEGLGFGEYIDGPAISVVEWGEKFLNEFPGNAKKVFIEAVRENERRIVVEC